MGRGGGNPSIKAISRPQFDGMKGVCADIGLERPKMAPKQAFLETGQRAPFVDHRLSMRSVLDDGDTHLRALRLIGYAMDPSNAESISQAAAAAASCKKPLYENKLFQWLHDTPVLLESSGSKPLASAWKYLIGGGIDKMSESAARKHGLLTVCRQFVNLGIMAYDETSQEFYGSAGLLGAAFAASMFKSSPAFFDGDAEPEAIADEIIRQSKMCIEHDPWPKTLFLEGKGRSIDGERYVLCTTNPDFGVDAIKSKRSVMLVLEDALEEIAKGVEIVDDQRALASIGFSDLHAAALAAEREEEVFRARAIVYNSPLPQKIEVLEAIARDGLSYLGGIYRADGTYSMKRGTSSIVFAPDDGSWTASSYMFRTSLFALILEASRDKNVCLMVDRSALASRMGDLFYEASKTNASIYYAPLFEAYIVGSSTPVLVSLMIGGRAVAHLYADITISMPELSRRFVENGDPRHAAFMFMLMREVCGPQSLAGLYAAAEAERKRKAAR